MKRTNNSKLRIIPIGGLEQIGMNITAFEYEDSIIVVDCGLAFPEDDMLGIDLVIPDVTYLPGSYLKSERVCHHPWTRGPYRSAAVYLERDESSHLYDKTYDGHYRK